MITKKKSKISDKCSLSFAPSNIESLFPVLDALAWLDLPDSSVIAQFAGIDPRTVGKLLKNCMIIGIVQSVSESSYTLAIPYPYKGSQNQKEAVIREALVKMPLMINMRQFLVLDNSLDDALRKAATMINVKNFESKAFAPLMKWAKQLDVLDPNLVIDDLVYQAEKIKEDRHNKDKESIVAFLSHSSKDKKFIRQLAADLTRNNVNVWLDEQKINVGDSIASKISQGLVESDFFIIALSDNSIESEWVKKELNQALISEIEDKKVMVLPLKLSECKIPELIKDKKYADFSKNYKTGLEELLKVFKEGDIRG